MILPFSKEELDQINTKIAEMNSKNKYIGNVAFFFHIRHIFNIPLFFETTSKKGNRVPDTRYMKKIALPTKN